MATELKRADRTVNENAVEKARDLLTRCESGEIVSFVSVVELRAGKYQVLNTSTDDRHRQAGFLMEAAMFRLGFDQPNP